MIAETIGVRKLFLTFVEKQLDDDELDKNLEENKQTKFKGEDEVDSDEERKKKEESKK